MGVAMHLCGRGWAAVMSSLSCCLVTFVLLLHRIHGQERCTPPKGRPSCVCETDKGLIDLTSIANTDGTPRYSTDPSTVVILVACRIIATKL